MEQILKLRRNYKDLYSYRKAECIYDITYHFCHKYLSVGDRTIDQMIQAARSGKQNIVEGCMAAATSTETHIKLLNVAKSSLQELLVDYEDFLRVRGLRQWESNSDEVARMRELGREHSDSSFYTELIKSRNDETVANIAIVLIHQADYLLHRQLQQAEQSFLDNGGIKEKMYNSRIAHRELKKQSE